METKHVFVVVVVVAVGILLGIPLLAGLAKKGQNGESVQGDAQAQSKQNGACERMSISELRKAAEQGDAEAQFKLGEVYMQGKEIPRNDAEFVKWWRKAAEQGHPAAQTGLYFHFSFGSPEDRAEGGKWLDKALAQGFPDAQFQAAITDLMRDGDAVGAFNWLAKAAEQGHFCSMGLLGAFYAEGKAVEKDTKKAHMWASRCLEYGEGRDDAWGGKGKAKEILDLVTREMKPEEISEAQKLAREWKPKE